MDVGTSVKDNCLVFGRWKITVWHDPTRILKIFLVRNQLQNKVKNNNNNVNYDFVSDLLCRSLSNWTALIRKLEDCL